MCLQRALTFFAEPAGDPMTAPFRLAIFTICSNNYIPVARTFLNSARQHHHEADFFICLADRVIEIPSI